MRKLRLGGRRPPCELTRLGGRAVRFEPPHVDTWDLSALDVKPHQPQVLASDDETRLVAIDLPAGEELQEHQTHERTFLVVVGGEIDLVQDGEVTSGGAGFLAHFEPNERRQVRATSDARLLLVLAPWPGVGHHSHRG